MSPASARLGACRSPPARPASAPPDSTRTDSAAGCPRSPPRSTTRRRAGARPRRREVGARRSSAGLGRRRRRRRHRVARDRAVVAAPRHPAPAAHGDAAADPRDHRAAQLQRAATRHRQLELDRDVYPRPRARRAALAGGASLSREELHAAWEAAGIATAGQRGYHLIWWLAQEAVVCCGPSRGAASASCCSTNGRRRRPASPTARRPSATSSSPTPRPRPGHRARLRLVERPHAHRCALGARRGRRRGRGLRRRARSSPRMPGGRPIPRRPRRARRAALALAAFDEYFLGYTDRSGGLRSAPCAEGDARPQRGVPADSRLGAGVVGASGSATRAKGAASVALDPFDPVDRPATSSPLRRWARFQATLGRDHGRGTSTAPARRRGTGGRDRVPPVP